RFQVPAAAFHVEDRFLLAEQGFLADLHRGVAAAVQHQGLVAAEQPRGVDAQAEVAPELLRFPIAPETLHRLPVCQLYCWEMRPAFTIRVLDWPEALPFARPIREQVFVEEQKVSRAHELNEWSDC